MNSTGHVLLLDGASMATLAFTRSLGRAGVRIAVADFQRDALAGRSRYCETFITYPSPLETPERFRQWLFEHVAKNRYDALIGTTDFTLPLLHRWRDELAKRAVLPLPPPTAFEIAYDKAATLELARSLGLRVPQMHAIRDVSQLEQVAVRRPWPIVLKPRSTVVERNGQRASLSVEYAFDANTLAAKFAALKQAGADPLLQEYVPGIGVGCFFLLHGEQVSARFQHRRIRDKNPTGSGSCLRVSVPADDKLHEQSERLLRAMGWQGLAMVEYRIATDGTAYLMEVNPRPWGSMQLAIEAGVDFPLLWWHAIRGQPSACNSYQAGVRCRHLAADLRHLEYVMVGRPRGWRLEYPARLPTLFQFLKFAGGNLRYDDFAAGDWRPGWQGIKNYFRGFGQRVIGRLRRAGK